MNGTEAAYADLRPLTAAEFEQIRALARENFGLDLRPGKEQLVSSRLGKRVRSLGLRTFRDYCTRVLADPTGQEMTGMIDALTTNHTSFLRESAHFEFLRSRVLPEWRERTTLEIWSAACATGEEPYSIAISALQQLGSSPRPAVRILATDISTRALETADRAAYPADRLDGLDGATLRKYFLKGQGRWRDWFRLRPHVRELVEFRRLNLNEPFPALPRFGVIFCRNVMIYFDRETQDRLVGRLAACLEPGGYLFTGHSESLLRTAHPLEYVQPAVYRKKPAEGARPGGPLCAR